MKIFIYKRKCKGCEAEFEERRPNNRGSPRTFCLACHPKGPNKKMGPPDRIEIVDD